MVFFMISLFFIPLVRFEDNVLRLDMNHKELEKRKTIITSTFKQSTDHHYLVFFGESRDDILIQSFQAFQTYYQKYKKPLFFMTALLNPPSTILATRKQLIKNIFSKKDFQNKLENTFFSSDSFSQWINTIEQIDELTLTELPEYIKEESKTGFIKWNQKEYLLVPLNYDINLQSTVDLLEEKKINFFTLNLIQDTGKHLLQFEKKSLILLFLSLIIIFLILIIGYKNLKKSFSALLPGLAALSTCIAVSVITQQKFNMMHFASCILGVTEPIVRGEDDIKTLSIALKIIEKIYEKLNIDLPHFSKNKNR